MIWKLEPNDKCAKAYFDCVVFMLRAIGLEFFKMYNEFSVSFTDYNSIILKFNNPTSICKKRIEVAKRGADFFILIDGYNKNVEDLPGCDKGIQTNITIANIKRMMKLLGVGFFRKNPKVSFTFIGNAPIIHIKERKNLYSAIMVSTNAVDICKYTADNEGSDEPIGGMKYYVTKDGYENRIKRIQERTLNNYKTVMDPKFPTGPDW